ncbi:hypothetical protein QBC32DRAFT_330953 [Pseudoneurospora amorphoporcata]|uniref:Uncharacterized protein n=1 Tax=Pseudoneurospora amorphoporcata TaxID=241081 RepID=A0AAN6P2J3_9PEZI|nr:hypothetical protein QBC32DRAFT_330953 [Pseudoneurospora amorphoporcata]
MLLCSDDLSLLTFPDLCPPSLSTPLLFLFFHFIILSLLFYRCFTSFFLPLWSSLLADFFLLSSLPTIVLLTNNLDLTPRYNVSLSDCVGHEVGQGRV